MTHNKGSTYYGFMNVTLSLDDELVKTVRKIAVDRDTTLTAMIREYLQKVAREAGEDAAALKREQLEALRASFRELSMPVGPRTWTRAELHERPRK